MSAVCFLSVFSGCKSDNVNGVKMSEQFKKRGILCLTFDDFSGENWLKADEIFKKYNAHATFFISGEITPEKAAVLKKLQDSGHSIGLHTVNHRDAAPLPENTTLEEYFKAQVLPQLESCEKYGLNIRGFAYPNNRRTPETDKVMFERFDYLRSGWYPSVDPIYYPVKEMTGKMVLRGGGIGEFYKTDPDVLKQRLSEAAANNCMIVFFSHNIYPHAPKIHMPTEWLEVILQHAQKLGMSISGINELPDAVKACSGN